MSGMFLMIKQIHYPGFKKEKNFFYSYHFFVTMLKTSIMTAFSGVNIIIIIFTVKLSFVSH
jgi:hypothetical protein